MCAEICEARKEVSKKFKIHFLNYKKTLFTSCHVCQENAEPGTISSSVQIEPTFSDQTFPEYHFDYTYDYVNAKLTFGRGDDVSNKVNLSIELHVCFETLLISLSCSGPNPHYYVSLMVDAGYNKAEVEHRITKLSIKVPSGQKERWTSSTRNRFFRHRFQKSDFFTSVHLRVFYPWLSDPIIHPEKTLECFKLSDRILVTTQDKRTLVCSKQSLVQISEFFHRMLASSMLESQTSQIHLTHFDQKVVKGFLHFVETGKLVLTELNILAELLYMSDMYLINEMKTECESLMVKLISPKNIKFITRLAQLFNAEMLHICIKDYKERFPMKFDWS